MTFRGIPGDVRATRPARAGRLMSAGLCFTILLATTAVPSCPAASTTPDNTPASEPTGTLLLPLTPKLDDGSGQLFDKSPPDAAQAASQAGPHKIRATNSAQLKPAPAVITPEKGDIETTDEPDDLGTSAGGDSKLMKGMVQIVADDTEFDQENNTFLGTGNAVCIIGGQNSKLEADTILYQQNDQMIDCRGNVKVLRDGQLTVGTSFKFNVASDQYLITDPSTEVGGSEIVARTMYGKGSGINFHTGTLTMPQPFLLGRNQANGPQSYKDQLNEKQNHPDAFVPPTQSWTFKARKMVYERYKDNQNLTIYGGKIMFGDFGIPLPKMVATVGAKDTKVMFPTSVQLSSNLQSGGTNFGPAFNTGIGKTGVLMWAPMIQIGGRSAAVPASENGPSIGLAGQIAYTDTNTSAHLGYGSVSQMLVADYKYRFNKHDKFQSGINRYLDDGMFGTRRARVDLELVDNHSINKIPYISNLNFRTSGGFAQDNPALLSQQASYGNLFTGVSAVKGMPSAMRFQEQITATTHPLFSIGNSQAGLKSYLYGGVAARGYSTGQANVIGQVGPVLDAYLGRLRFQTGYTQSAVRGSDPFVFDQFIQGNQSVQFTGDYRISKFLTLGGSLSYNLNSKAFTGKSITAAIGPEDFKLLLSRDMIRGTNRFGFDVLYGQPVPFNKLVLKGVADQGQLGGI
jgi:hypothetical protein